MRPDRRLLLGRLHGPASRDAQRLAGGMVVRHGVVTGNYVAAQGARLGHRRRVRLIRDDAGQIGLGGATHRQHKLGMLANEEIVCAKRLCVDDTGAAIKFEISITPSQAFPHDLDDDKLRSMTTIELAHCCGLALGQMRETVKIVKPSRETARALGVKPSDHVMCLDRLLLRLDGAPLEWRIAWCAMREDLLYCASES